MKSQLDKLKLQFQFFPAVDGRQLSRAEFEQKCDMNRVRELPDLLTPGMVGCSLSHYEVYREIVRQKIPLALVLEDDTQLSADIPSVLNEIETLYSSGRISNGELVLLYYQKPETIAFTSEGQETLNGKYSINHPLNIAHLNTTTAYVIPFECADRLSRILFPIRYSPDCWGDFFKESGIDGLRCVLPLPTSSGYFKSDIGYELNNPLNNFIKFLESNNVFPIKQLLQNRRRRRALNFNKYAIVAQPRKWFR